MNWNSDDEAAMPVDHASHRRDRKWLGVLFLLFNIALMTLVGAFVKELSDRYPVFQMLLARFGPAALAFLILSLRAGRPWPHQTTRPIGHLLRSLFGTVAIGLTFYAFATIPLAEATVLVYAAPLFVTILAIPLLGETVGPQRWAAVLCGCVGMVIIAWPFGAGYGLESVGPGTLAAIAAAVFGAFVAIFLRKLGDTERTEHIAFVYNLFGSLVWIALGLAVGFTLPVGWDIAMFLAIAILGIVQQFLFTACYRYAEVSLLAPFDYSALPFAGILGFVYWGEEPALSTWVGAVIIVGAGLFVLRRERVLAAQSRMPATLRRQGQRN